MGKFVKIPNIPIVKAGRFLLGTGWHTFTEKELADSVKAWSDDPSVKDPRLKLGHVTAGFGAGEESGHPAFGRYRNLRFGRDENGTATIFADLTGVPEFLANLLPVAYPNRSIEARTKVTTPMGGSYDMVIDAVSSLGIEMPGVSTLEDLEMAFDHPEVNLVTASSGGTVIQITAASSRETQEEGMGMTPEQLRQRLGLPADATDEQVETRIQTLVSSTDPGNKPGEDANTETNPPEEPPASPQTSPEPQTTPSPDQEPSPAPAESPAPPQTTPENAPTTASAGKLPDGVVMIDKDTLDQLKASAEKGKTVYDAQIKAGREAVVDSAIMAGKFPPASRNKYLQLMETDPDGTKNFIDKLEAGLIPVSERGTDGQPEVAASNTTKGPAYPDEWLTAAERRRRDAALAEQGIS